MTYSSKLNNQKKEGAYASLVSILPPERSATIFRYLFPGRSPLLPSKLPFCINATVKATPANAKLVSLCLNLVLQLLSTL